MKQILLFYLLFFFLFSSFFLFLFHTPLFADQKVLFYRGIELLVISVLVIGVLGGLGRLGLLGQLKKIKTETFAAALVMSASLNLVFFVVFPVTFDRSVTTFLLDTINTRPSATFKDLQDSFIKEYVQENKAVERRIYEESQIGFVIRENQGIVLSRKAKKFLEFAGWVKRLYGIN